MQRRGIAWILLASPGVLVSADPFRQTAYCQCNKCQLAPGRRAEAPAEDGRDGFVSGWVDTPIIPKEQCQCQCMCDPIKYFNWDESETYCDWTVSPRTEELPHVDMASSLIISDPVGTFKQNFVPSCSLKAKDHKFCAGTSPGSRYDVFSCNQNSRSPLTIPQFRELDINIHFNFTTRGEIPKDWCANQNRRLSCIELLMTNYTCNATNSSGSSSGSGSGSGSSSGSGSGSSSGSGSGSGGNGGGGRNRRRKSKYAYYFNDPIMCGGIVIFGILFCACSVHNVMLCYTSGEGSGTSEMKRRWRVCLGHDDGASEYLHAEHHSPDGQDTWSGGAWKWGRRKGNRAGDQSGSAFGQEGEGELLGSLMDPKEDYDGALPLPTGRKGMAGNGKGRHSRHFGSSNSHPPVLKYAHTQAQAPPHGGGGGGGAAGGGGKQSPLAQQQSPMRLGSVGGLFFTDGDEGSISNIARSNYLGRKWLLDFDELIIGEKLAAGSSGQVFQGTFCGKPVAIKNLYVAVEHIGAWQIIQEGGSGEVDGEGEAGGGAGTARGAGRQGAGAEGQKQGGLDPPQPAHAEVNTPPTQGGGVGAGVGMGMGAASGNGCGDDEVHATVREFMSETKILSRLRHENVVRFYGVCHHQQDLYIVQELCACSLRDITYHRIAKMRAKQKALRSSRSSSDRQQRQAKRRQEAGGGGGAKSNEAEPGMLTIDEVVSLLRQVACGMAYVHSKGLIHRDLKPANLLLDRPPPSMASALHDGGTGKQSGKSNGGGSGGSGSNSGGGSSGVVDRPVTKEESEQQTREGGSAEGGSAEAAAAAAAAAAAGDGRDEAARQEGEGEAEGEDGSSDNGDGRNKAKKEPLIGVVKICDFGLARWWAHTKTGREATMTGCGTPFYMAPELIMGHRYNEKVDVFSFAIVAWGLLTGAQVYRGFNQFEVPSRVCRAGLRPHIPSSCPAFLAQLMQQCWCADPVARPSFTSIINRLDRRSVFALPCPQIKTSAAAAV